jgi:RNA-directed DNA polymerase
LLRVTCSYYGMPMNSPAIGAFRKAVSRLWQKVLKRRSQKHDLAWDRMKRLVARHIPPTRICHPYLYPLVRFGVITRGRSPVR